MPKVNADKFVQNHFKIFLVISMFRIEILLLLHAHTHTHSHSGSISWLCNQFILMFYFSFFLSFIASLRSALVSISCVVCLWFRIGLVCFVCFCNYQCHKKLILTQLKSIVFFLLFFYFCRCCWSIAC